MPTGSAPHAIRTSPQTDLHTVSDGYDLLGPSVQSEHSEPSFWLHQA